MSTSNAVVSPSVQEESPPNPKVRKRGSGRRPPTARDLRIYELAVIQELPQAQVAQEVGLSQGYVSKRARRVVEWMGRVGNKEYGELPAEEKLRYLVRFAEKKYHFYRQEAEAAWQESRRDLVVIKERGTRQASRENDEQNVGKFEGEVKIEKTIRPREGNPQLLRESRLALESTVLLGWGCVGRRDLQVAPEPDEAARLAERQLIVKELQEKRILDAKVACRNQEIGILKHELAVARQELNSARGGGLGAGGEFGAGGKVPMEQGTEALPESAAGRPAVGVEGGIRSPASNGAPNGESQKQGECDASRQRAKPARRLVLLSRNTACVPLTEEELKVLEKDGLKFLDEVLNLSVSIEPINEYDKLYVKRLRDLWKNSDWNYRNHGVIPERQNFPRLDVLRKGWPYWLTVPPMVGKPNKEPPPRWVG